MSHSKNRPICRLLVEGAIACLYGTTFVYKTERELKTKVRLHNKYCNVEGDSSHLLADLDKDYCRSITNEEFFKKQAKMIKEHYKILGNDADK